MKSGKIIGIFPEGTISKTDELLPFKIGAVKMAKDTNTKIVPFGISGKYKMFSNDLKITFGEPVIVNDDLEKANKRLEEEVAKLMKESLKNSGK